MFPTIPRGSPPPAYAPLLLDTPVQSQPSIYPPPGPQSPSSPSISDLEIQFIGDTQKVLLLRNMFTNFCWSVRLYSIFTSASPQWYPGNITSVFTSHADARVWSPGFHHMPVPGNQPKKKKKTCKTSFSESAVSRSKLSGIWQGNQGNHQEPYHWLVTYIIKSIAY